jgi:branched-chain amino acid aminotransferase
MDEILDTSSNGRLKEAFASGTAAIVSPIGEISYRKRPIIINEGKTGKLTEKLYNEILQIQYGEKDDPFGWRVPVRD